MHISKIRYIFSKNGMKFVRDLRILLRVDIRYIKIYFATIFDIKRHHTCYPMNEKYEGVEF